MKPSDLWREVDARRSTRREYDTSSSKAQRIGAGHEIRRSTGIGFSATNYNRAIAPVATWALQSGRLPPQPRRPQYAQLSAIRAEAGNTSRLATGAISLRLTERARPDPAKMETGRPVGRGRVDLTARSAGAPTAQGQVIVVMA